METITVVGLIIIGIGIGFILTKGFQLNKEIKNKKNMSTLTINNNNNNKVLNNNYNLYVPFTCVDSGWENGATGGTGTCEGYIEFTFADLLGIQNGFIRFISNGDNGQYGTYRTNFNPIIINQNIDITELFRTTLFAQCGATYPCSPTIYNTVYNIEYSNNGLNNWQQFNLKVG